MLAEEQYLNHLEGILSNGVSSPSGRDNMPDTYKKFGISMEFDLREGFPLLTTKKIDFRKIVVELLWFLKGEPNIKFMVDNDCNIWNDDSYRFYKEYIAPKLTESEVSKEEFLANLGKPLLSLPINYEYGHIGYSYPALWRGKYGLLDEDQIKNVIETLKTNPHSRRIIIDSWKYGGKYTALPPCHVLSQFDVEEIPLKVRVDRLGSKLNMNTMIIWEQPINDIRSLLKSHSIPEYYLSCSMFQRSADFFLGVPFNIASYSLLLHMVARQVNMIPAKFIHFIGNAHLYKNHVDQARLQISREIFTQPKLWNKRKDIPNDLADYEIDDFEIVDYKHHPFIKAPLSTGL